MQVVILAGGRGERLRPLTDTTPKPMVLVNGYPFLWHLISRLKRDGFGDFLVCVGYLAQGVMGYFGDGTRLSVCMRYSIEHELLGTGGALRNAYSLLDERFLLLNGDTFAEVPYRLLSDSRFPEPIMMTISTHPANARNVLFDGEIVLEYDKTPHERFNGSDAGAYVVSKEVVSTSPGKSSLESGLFPAYALSKSIRAYPIQTRFYDIGTSARLEEFRAYATAHNLGNKAH